MAPGAACSTTAAELPAWTLRTFGLDPTVFSDADAARIAAGIVEMANSTLFCGFGVEKWVVGSG